MQPLEEPEHALLRLFWNANAVILKPKTDHAVVRFAPNPDMRPFSRWHEFHGIIEQVTDALA
jgi:hypothetical protein